MSADNPETDEERIQYLFEVSFGSYLLERAAAGEPSIDLRELDIDLLKRFFRFGWRSAYAFLTPSEESEFTEWHKEGPNPPLLEEEALYDHQGSCIDCMAEEAAHHNPGCRWGVGND